MLDFTHNLMIFFVYPFNYQNLVFSINKSPVMFAALSKVHSKTLDKNKDDFKCASRRLPAHRRSILPIKIFLNFVRRSPLT
jgi:hypothetical protein